jgi:dephospho-CoA kinase
MRIVVTGGIASGKSTVCNALVQHMPGYVLVSADQMVRDLYADSVPFRAGLVERFGTTDRRAISALVFSDASRRADLEALSWVYLHQAVDALFEQQDIIFEFPLFFEHPHWLGRPDAVIVLGCDDASQRQRAMARDGLTEEAFTRIRAAQLPLAEKVRRADIYLDTGGTLASVLDAVAALPARLSQLKMKKVS